MNNDILDLPEFLERVQDDKALLLELLDIYQEDFVAKRDILQKAIAANNCEEVRGVAHSLKGASGNISAKRLRQIFLRLEDMAKKNDLSAAGSLVVEMEKEYALVLERFTQIKKEFK
ncbi:MAG: Hpt domain-containing protein [Candidatus Omnitrophica bacterium]|nr:Hpt domain-containing protein [Candidatus Omnitrophota bacterium]